MQQHDLGEVVHLTAHFYDTEGNAAEPTAIELLITAPDGTPTVKQKADLTPTVGLDPASDWSYDQAASVVGLWRYSFTGVVASRSVTESNRFLVGADARVGPCEPWCSWDDVVKCSGTGLEDVSLELRESALDQATEILWNLSGRVYTGICETTRSLCFGCRTCWPTCCTCEPWNGVDLGIRWPVWAVWDVVVNGETLDPSEYTLIDRRWLARTDHRMFPRGWDMHDPSAFRATWAFGRQVPEGGRRAAALYAAGIARRCQALGCSNAKDNVVSVSAEGVNYVIDPAMLDTGRTGDEMVDAWLISDRIGRRPRTNIFAPGAGTRKAYR